MAQTKSSQPGAGSNPARVGNREQARRGLVAGGTGGRGGRGVAVGGGGTGGGGGSSPAMPLAGGRGRRGNPLDFIRDVRSELRKVAWPTGRETANLTIVVIAMSVALGLFLGGFDYVFQELFRWLISLTQGPVV